MKHKLLTLILLISSFSFSQQKEFKLTDIFTNPEFYPKTLRGVHWFDEGNKFSYLDAEPISSSASIFEYDVKSGEQKILFSVNDLRKESGNENFEIDNYKWSPKGNYILFTGTIHARSLKTGGDFYAYDVKEKKFLVHVTSDKHQANIKFSPDESNIGFVRDNNLFVVDVKTAKETQLTDDGSEVILNGVFDWAYEEEFSIIEAWDWSPDSKKIAFWRIDQSNVPVFPITRYDSLYLNIEDQRYPKVGAAISEVKIGVVDVTNSKTTWMDTGTEKNIYLPRMNFTNNPDIVSIQRLNRLQNKLELLFADVNTGKTKTVLTEEDKQWVDVWDHLTFLKQSERFTWSSDRDGYLHLYLYDYEGNLISQVTKGNFEVDKLLSVDEKSGKIYYTSNESSPLRKDLYSIGLDGTGKQKITSEPGTHNIKLSSNNKFYIDNYSSANILTIESLHNIDGSIIRTLSNPEMAFKEEYSFSPVEFQNITTSDGVDLNAFIVKPKDFDNTKKYPLIIFNYSGPGSQEVLDKWKGYEYYLFQYYVQHGYIVFTIDNRGTGGRGKEFEHIVYKNLGKWELNDIVEGIKYLNKEGYIDSSRVGISGSSYGGYVTALALLKEPNYFKLGIAVAPVTHWKYYDAIYTERYMQDEDLNPGGYAESAPLSYVKNLSGKLFIVHGTTDDNVHFQNSVELIDALQKLNKQFDMMIYPGKRHGGYGKHYIYLIADYFLKNL